MLPCPGRRLAALASLSALTALLAVAGPADATTGVDPLRNRQFGLTVLHVRDAWISSGTLGAGVTIAVVDSGVDRTHGDLTGRLTAAGATFLGCPSSASCGNGDWLSGPTARRGLRSPHGTHVAGIATATKDNRIGTVGVAPQARLLPVKVLDEQGGSEADIARGIRYAATAGAKVINLSLGLDPQSSTLATSLGTPISDAVAFAGSRGALVVAAAGNEMAPLCDEPAAEQGALCVTAVDKREQPAFYSNGAVKPGMTSVAAPGGAGSGCGEDVVSTLPARYDVQDPCHDGVSFGELAGTSMATPHVAGVAALLFAQGRSRANVLEALLSTARTPGTGTGAFTPEYGRGIVDAAAAVRYPKG